MNYVVNPKQVTPDITMNKEKGFTERPDFDATVLWEGAVDIGMPM